MPLNQEQYKDAAFIKKYLSVMVDTLAKVHPNKNARDRAEALAAQVLELETQTANILPSTNDYRDPAVCTRLSPERLPGTEKEELTDLAEILQHYGAERSRQACASFSSQKNH